MKIKTEKEIQDFNEQDKPLLQVNIDTDNHGKTFKGTIEIEELSLEEISDALRFLSESIFEMGWDVLEKKSMH